ncbi:DUF1565 domain-containing protein [Vibrio sp. 2art]|uniref:DUF1565 domain-containing protein n=1 Tax=Vibrio sp. 2art TaxID=2998832 RepID=UPI0022CD6C60|nr:DUF1565 domain-containing protein [Vibrio sp. 2art]MDA0115541.1 DUF1565 domain-containing protein [Vibrio sp. 2art]
MSDPLFQALIESNRRLTDTFENKANEIDQKVEQTANEIAQTITSNNVVTYYVDAENGDDANTGASSSPFKTVKRAITLCPTGSKAKILLARGNRYVLDGSTRSYAAFVEIMPDIYNTDQTKAYHYDETTPVLAIEGSINLYGSICFGGFRRSMIIETNENTPSGTVSCWGASTITIARSRLILNKPADNLPVFGSDYNYLNPLKVSLRDADIVKTKGFIARGGCLFSVDFATGFQYTDEVILNATKDNTPSNVPFTPEG